MTLSENKIIINIEGVDGTGKTTIADFLWTSIAAQYGESQVLLLREPGGTSIGEKIRRIIKSKAKCENNISLTLLFMAARAELVARIKKAEEKYIIIDRFTPSTIAYQVHNSDYLEFVVALDKRVRDGVIPDIVLYLYCETEKSLGRIKERDGETDSFFDKDSAFNIQSRYTLARETLGWKWRGVYTGAELETTKVKVLEILKEEELI